MIPIQTIQTETFSMEYIHFGSGKKTMIILPGVSVQSVMPSAQLIADAYDIFTKDYTLYVFERRNHLPEDASIHSMAEDMHIVLSQLGLKDIYLFGVSLGGMIGLDLTMHHPEEIKAFALGSGVARLHEKSQSVLKHWISLASEGKVEDLELSFGQMVYPEPVFEQLKQTFIEMAASVKPEELTQFIRCVSAVGSYDVLDRVSVIPCPLLILGNKDDKVFGEQEYLELYRQFQGREDVQLHMYEGFGHAAYDVAPDYKERLLRFFASV